MLTSQSSDVLDNLATIRDWLRFAISRFNAADLVYGHGTENATDEAAFLILKALNLPIDQLDPWLDAKLIPSERQTVLGIIESRIATRKPAPYLVGEAWIGDHRFYVDERVIVPRSFIGELLCSGLDVVVPDPRRVKRVLDLCTGSGCLAILAARAFPNAVIDAADISADALSVARRNVEDYSLEDRIRLLSSNLFDALSGQRYDLIISNPPYVSASAVAAFPPEYRAEPVLAHAGGDDGLDVVRRIIDQARQHLTPKGQLVVEIGAGRELLEQSLADLDVLWLDTQTSTGEVFAVSAAALKTKPTRPTRNKSARPD